MLARNREIEKRCLWLLLGLTLAGLLLFSACASSQGTIARSRANQWADALSPPANTELLFEDSGVARPDRRGCWAAYANRVYGADDPALAVINHYDQNLSNSQDWVKHSIIDSDHFIVYDHPDGSSAYISTEIDSDFPDQFARHQTHYKTLFYVIITSRPPDVRARCRGG